MIKVHRFVFTSSILISTLRTLSSCETNSTADLKVQKGSNQKTQSKETETDTSNIEIPKNRKSEIFEDNFLYFNEFERFFSKWSKETYKYDSDVLKHTWAFNEKFLEKDKLFFVYKREKPEAFIEITSHVSFDGSKEKRCEFYTTSLQEYEKIIEEIDKKKFKPDRSKRSYIYHIGSYEDYTLSPKGETKRSNATLYYLIEIVHYQGKELSETVILE